MPQRFSFEAPDFALAFDNLPGLHLILDSHFTIVAQNRAHAEATLTKRADTVGRALFEVFPDNPGKPGTDGVSNLRASLLRVLKTRAPHELEIQQ